MSVGQKLFESITSSDWYIGVAAIIELMLLGICLFFAFSVKKRIEEWRSQPNEPFTHYLCGWLDVFYSLFLTVITIFPLLGMFGTVTALLGVNMAGDMAQLQNRFFDALTSTAWGIIFAITFKIANGLAAPFIERQIEEAQELGNCQEDKEDKPKVSILKKSENVLPVGKAEAVERYFGETAASREDIFEGAKVKSVESEE